MYEKNDRIALYKKIRMHLQPYSTEDIEKGIMLFCLNDYKQDGSVFLSQVTSEIAELLRADGFNSDLEFVIGFFESLLSEENISENGVIFTPRYISDLIVKAAISEIDSDTKIAIIDPSCGCGIFLVSAVEYLKTKLNVSIDYIIDKYIYGIELDKDNVRRCKLVLKLLSAKHGGSFNELKTNIICRDSLKCDWNKEFKTENFNYIIGNPPYVNPHDMPKDTVEFLKANYTTTQKGVFNIFYAFIEKSMAHLTEDGKLGFILPNNFLTIKSALSLRSFIQENNYLDTIIDFGSNMVFKPTRTYNCIMLLSKSSNNDYKYYAFPQNSDIKASISHIVLKTAPQKTLDENGWKLIETSINENIHKIESQGTTIKDFIRTGIATLRDAVYMVKHDDEGFFKIVDSKKIYIEDGLVKPIYKIPELRHYSNVSDAQRYIIFPYQKKENGYALIDENTLKTVYPNTYKCLCLFRKELDKRDKGKGSAYAWYAYGRTQGLNKYGKKLLFPTFSDTPKYTLINNADALFCNGYAVFENEKYELDILQKVLNSELMNYYVSNTSYSIEGGYYCYQKKYIEQFSLPDFSEQDKSYIRSASKKDLDIFLWNLYGLA